MSSPPPVEQLSIADGAQDSDSVQPASPASSENAQHAAHTVPEPIAPAADTTLPPPTPKPTLSHASTVPNGSSFQPIHRPAPPANGTAATGNGAPSNTRSPLPGRGIGLGAGRGMPVPMGMRSVRPAGGQQLESRIPASLQAKMDAIAASRAGPAPSSSGGANVPNPSAASMSALLRSQALAGSQSSLGPNAGPLGLAARRGLAGSRPPILPGVSAPARLVRPGASTLAGRRGPPGGLSLSGMAGAPKPEENKFNDFGKIMDPSGSLRFSKAVLHSKGVDFEDGASFKINMDEIDVVGELGRGNYGSVQKVYHRPTGVFMAMKEIRLELDESKLNGIIMELDILHRAKAPEIVEFYGAFTIESCVYYCMEFMDARSIDYLTGGGQPAEAGQSEDNEDGAIERVPEPVLRRITASVVRGLHFLKDELQIMHRDVKPTNVLINTKGQVKLCDFGVSGQLEKSLAKTNIGCQSYMAPERIKGESQNQLSTYTVASDVWSVGLSIIELAKGCYPYPPETFANVFAQLSAIVHGMAPTLPKGYSDDANDFVAKCLIKDPNGRPTYAQLLEHPFLVADRDAEVDMVGWVKTALERRAARGVTPLPPAEA